MNYANRFRVDLTAMEALLAQMYADDNLEGPTAACRWGDWGDWSDWGVQTRTDIGNEDCRPSNLFDKEEQDWGAPLAYSVTTYTQHANGHFYKGYPIPAIQPPSVKNAIYVPRLSMTSSEVSSDITEDMVADNAEVSEVLSEASWEDEFLEFLEEDEVYAGKFVYSAGWRDATKNYGFIKLKAPIKGMTRLIVFDPPQECRRGDTVLFTIVPNKRGNDAWKAVIKHNVNQ